MTRDSSGEATETLSLEGIEPIDLLGRNDQNLRVIEASMSGRIVVRGDQVFLKGQFDEVKALKRVLVGLIDMVRRKKAISEDDVRYAIEHRTHAESTANLADRTVVLNSRRESVIPKTFGQRDYLDAIQTHDIVFAIGPAGTGKTYLAIAAAVAALRKKEVDRIVLARPAVEAGESLGFLPGDFQEKVDPYLRPLYDALQDLMGEESLRRSLENGVVEVVPLAYMRGRTLRHAFVILDEAQNATLGQLKMFLTRLGPASRSVVTGDVTQVDLPNPDESGLIKVQPILQDVEGIAFIYLSDSDVVRHRLVQKIILAFEKNSPSPNGDKRQPGGSR